MNEKIWSFANDVGWTLVAHPVPYEDGADCAAVQKAAGYELCDSFGLEFLCMPMPTETCEVWRGSRPEAPEFLVFWQTSQDIFHEMAARDLPSLLTLLGMLTPLVAQRDTALFYGMLTEVLSKAFEAWHGHEVTRECRECDRRAWERAEQRRRERRAKKLS